MRNRSVLWICLVFALDCCTEQKQSSPHIEYVDSKPQQSNRSVSLEDYVKSIDQFLWPYEHVVGYIKELKSTQGNEVVAYFREGTLEVVASKIYGEMGRDERYLYINNNKVVALRNFGIVYHKVLTSGPSLEDTCRSFFYVREMQVDSCVDEKNNIKNRCEPCDSASNDMTTLIHEIKRHFLDTLKPGNHVK